MEKFRREHTQWLLKTQWPLFKVLYLLSYLVTSIERELIVWEGSFTEQTMAAISQ